MTLMLIIRFVHNSCKSAFETYHYSNRYCKLIMVSIFSLFALISSRSSFSAIRYDTKSYLNFKNRLRYYNFFPQCSFREFRQLVSKLLIICSNYILGKDLSSGQCPHPSWTAIFKFQIFASKCLPIRKVMKKIDLSCEQLNRATGYLNYSNECDGIDYICHIQAIDEYVPRNSVLCVGAIRIISVKSH